MTARARVPVGWLIALGVMGLMVGLAIGFVRDRVNAQIPAQSGGGAPPVDPAVDPGRAAYVACQGCHQPDGHGLPGFAPPLAGSAFATGDERAAIRAVLDGITGDSTWRSTMAGQRDRLDNAQIAAVLTYVRGAWGNHAPAVTENTVTMQRALDTHDGPWTRTALANALADDGPEVMAGALPPDATAATGAAP
jgi:mono/diheme cytochrome c family protein